MISSTLRARWNVLTTVLGLDPLRAEPDLCRQAATASAAVHDTHVAEHDGSDVSAAAAGVGR